MQKPTENEIRALLGGEVSEEDIKSMLGEGVSAEEVKSILAPPSLQPLIDATDVIPEQERIPPYQSVSGLDRFFTNLGLGASAAGLRTPQPLPVAVPQLAQQLGRPMGDVLQEMQAGQMQALRYADAPELFFRGMLAYGLETAPARIARKGFRAIPGPLGGIKGKEETRPVSFRNMIDWGIKSVTGTSPEVEKHTQWSHIFERLSKTEPEIEATNQWFERHKGMKRARQVSDMATEFAVGAAFEIALGYGVGKATGVLKNFFSTAKPGMLRKGFSGAIIDQMDEFDVARKGVPFVGGVSMEDLRSALPIGRIPAIEPPLDIGYKRLYRIEPSETISGKIPEWIPTEHMGRWFTDKPANLEWYLVDMPEDLTPVVRYVDIPEEQAAKFNVKNVPEAAKYSADPDTEYFIPREFVDEGRIITDVSAVISGASKLPVGIDVDLGSSILLYRSYLNRLQETNLVPSKVMGDLVDAASFGRAKSIDQLNRLELESVLNDTAVYMNAGIDAKPVVTFVDQHIRPNHDVFRRLGLFEYFADVDAGQRLVRNFTDESEAFMRDVKRLYKKQFNTDWGAEEAAAASYFSERKILPKKVYEPLGNKFGGTDTDEYSNAIDFIREFVDTDKFRFSDVLRDEAVRQGRIGPGTDVPVQNYYLYQITQDRAKERISRARTGYRATGKEARFIDTTPRDMYAPEFLRRRGNIPDELLEMDYEVRRYLFHRDEARKLWLQPPVDRTVAIVESITQEVTEDNKMVRQWLSDWVEKGVYAVPTKFDATLNASVNKASKLMEQKLRGKWSPTGRAGEHALEMVRSGVSHAVIAGNLRPFFKNLFQSLLNYPYLGSKGTAAGFACALSKEGRGLMDDLGFVAARGPRGQKILYGAMDITDRKVWDNLLTYGQISAVDRYMNAPVSVGGRLWVNITGSRRKMQELVDFGAAFGLREQYVKGAGFWYTLRRAIQAGKFRPDVLQAEKELFGTQWYYGRLGASDYMMASHLRLAGQFTTWPAHFTTVYLRQLLGQAFGEPTITGKSTKFVKGAGVVANLRTASDRAAVLKFIGMAATLHYVGKEMGMNLDFIWNGIFGVGGGPGAGFIGSAGKLVGGQIKGNDRMRDEGWNGVKDGLPIILGLPGWVAGKRGLEVYKGEREPYELLWTPTREEEKARQPLQPSRPSLPKY